MNVYTSGLLSILLSIIQLPTVSPQSISVTTSTLTTVIVGATAQLECTFDSTTTPKDIYIYWLKVNSQGDELILEINDDYSSVQVPYKGRFKRQGATRNLQINDVRLADAGIYKCNVTILSAITRSDASNVELVVKGDNSSTTLVVVLLILAFFIAVGLVFLVMYISRKRKRSKDASVTDGVSSESVEDKGLNKKFMWNDVSLDANNRPPSPEPCPPSPGGNSSVTSYPCSTAFSERSVSDIYSFFSCDDRGSIAYPPPTPLNRTLERASLAYPSPTQLSGTFDWGFMGHPSGRERKSNDNNSRNPIVVTKSTSQSVIPNTNLP